MLNPDYIDTMVSALKDCVVALDLSGHGPDMRRTLTCDNSCCWMCDVAAAAAALVAEYESIMADG